jgi:hypothetical protein
MSLRYLVRVLALGVLLSLPAGAIVAAPPAIGSHPDVVTADASNVRADVRSAADLSLFRPGNIISDATFFNASAMSAPEIQSFLESKVPSCRSGYKCLKDWTDTSRTVAADAMCGAYSGVANERASQIVYKVAQACGVNPRVLLVMLQKEQGLVTHTWPSDWRYTIAMGQGCPDTAACDTRYYGFFNQVYGAAWQMKRYANPPGTSAYFTWHAPGKTSNVRYNPDQACGSSPVLIENQATANLYYYTPYQPNAAALRAGYGEGDACSAYGNRNFYNYFTDWFGSTQSAGPALARTAADSSVYLLSASSRWHVADAEDYAELAKAFGPAAVVGSAFLSKFVLRGTTGAVLHNASTGVMSLVQAGALHRIPTCESAAMWGASCGSPTTVESSLLARLSVGPDVGLFFRLRASGWGRFDSSSSVTPLYDEAAARAVNGDMRATPFAPYLPAARYAVMKKAPLVFAPGQLVRASTESRVYMTADFDRLLAVNTWADVAEYSRLPSSLVTVPPADLSRYRSDEAVAPTLRCPSGTYLLAGGVLHRLGTPERAGLRTVDVAEITCAQFPLGEPAPAALALRAESDASVFVIEAAQRKRALTWGHLVAVNGGSAPPVFVVKSATLQTMAFGSPVADGLLVKGTTADLVMVSGGNSHWLPSFDVAREIGVPTSFAIVSDAEIAALTPGAALGIWVDCGGIIGFGASGRIYTVTGAAATGFTPLALSPSTCARLTTERSDLNRVFLKSAGSPAVFVAENAVYRQVKSWSELLSLSQGPPKILTVSDGTLASLPRTSG